MENSETRRPYSRRQNAIDNLLTIRFQPHMVTIIALLHDRPLHSCQMMLAQMLRSFLLRSIEAVPCDWPPAAAGIVSFNVPKGWKWVGQGMRGKRCTDILEPGRFLLYLHPELTDNKICVLQARSGTSRNQLKPLSTAGHRGCPRSISVPWRAPPLGRACWLLSGFSP